jgi:hypothetical protein
MVSYTEVNPERRCRKFGLDHRPPGRETRTKTHALIHVELAPDRTVKTSTYECHDRNPLIRSTLRENNLKPTGAVLIGFGQVGQPQRFPVSRETPSFAGLSGWARWKGPDGRKRWSLLALWVHGFSSWPTVTKEGSVRPTKNR